MRFTDRLAWVVGLLLVQVTFALTLRAAVSGGEVFDLDRVTTATVWSLLGVFLHTRGSDEIEGWTGPTGGEALRALKQLTIFQAVASILSRGTVTFAFRRAETTSRGDFEEIRQVILATNSNSKRKSCGI